MAHGSPVAAVHLAAGANRDATSHWPHCVAISLRVAQMASCPVLAKPVEEPWPAHEKARKARRLSPRSPRIETISLISWTWTLQAFQRARMDQEKLASARRRRQQRARPRSREPATGSLPAPGTPAPHTSPRYAGDMQSSHANTRASVGGFESDGGARMVQARSAALDPSLTFAMRILESFKARLARPGSGADAGREVAWRPGQPGRVVHGCNPSQLPS